MTFQKHTHSRTHFRNTGKSKLKSIGRIFTLYRKNQPKFYLPNIAGSCPHAYYNPISKIQNSKSKIQNPKSTNAIIGCYIIGRQKQYNRNYLFS